MSEYIERGALMDKIGERLAYLREKNDYDHEFTDGYEECYCEVEEAPAADVAPIQRWIKCEDRLPEMEENVLMRFNNNTAVGFILEIDEHSALWCAYIDDGFYEYCDDEPLYWMPLPEPPKMDGGNGDE